MAMTKSVHRLLSTITLLTLTVFLNNANLTSAAPKLLLDDSFEDKLISGVDSPTDFAFLPTGELLVAEKRGKLYIVEDPSSGSKAKVIYDLADIICTDGERGLSGLAVHPNFEENRFIYMFYTYMKGGTSSDGCVGVNKLSRFRLPASTMKVDGDSNRVLFTTPELYAVMHNSGNIHFGKDEYLYVTVGDSGAKKPAQDLGSLLGKMVRITDDGDIPDDNPFTGSDSARCYKDGEPPSGSDEDTKCQEIYAYGLRNPFKFSMNPNVDHVHYFINDVGATDWEEINEGGADFMGANYGYPVLEGPCEKGSRKNCKQRDWAQDPVHWYEHRDDGHACVLGSTFVPNGVWPEEFDNSYLYSDYIFGEIFQIKLDDENGKDCRKCIPPTSKYQPTKIAEIKKVVSMQFGPYKDGQALFYISRFGNSDTTAGVRAIVHTGNANRDPIAIIHTGDSPLSGDKGFEVVFDASASEDPDGDGLKFRWDFDGDGKKDSSEEIVTHVYANEGTFHATLTVRDGKGGKSTDTIRIDVGNHLPEPVILQPEEDTKFAVGESFTLKGEATDEEDGDLDSSSLTWEVRQHHGNHWHPFLDAGKQGYSIELRGAPSPEDFFASTNSYLEIRLTATDSSGLSKTVSRFVQPKKVKLLFDSNPSGLDVYLDGEKRTMPETIISWENHELEVKGASQRDNGKDYSWVSWSDGGSKEHTYIVPSSNPDHVIVAEFEIDGEIPSSGTSTLTPTDDASIAEDKNSGNNNYGDDTVLSFDANSGVWNSLLSFDLSDISRSYVHKSLLRLYCTDPSPEGGAFVGLVDTTFDEDDVTWNTAPNSSVESKLGSIDRILKDNWYELDITEFVQDSAGDPITIRISSIDENKGTYASKEFGDGKAPQLIIWMNAD